MKEYNPGRRKPIVPGYYMRKYNQGRQKCLWNGKFWCKPGSETERSDKQSLPWREENP